MKKAITDRPSYPLSPAQVEQLEALEGRAPDTQDIPPAPDAHWADAVRGRHLVAMQGAIAIRLDADVLGWLDRKGPGYEAAMNRILRDRMEAEAAT